MSVQTYFLSANSAQGFYSLYNYFCPPEGKNFLWIIKGGPGCGKSSFMKKIGKAAEEKGYDVEYILCSGDPDSVDGVYIPQINLGYVDGTAPHTQDVLYPGANGLYLDLGQFYNKQELQRKADQIQELNRKYRDCYTKAYANLASVTCDDVPISDIVCQKRFHTAISCKGIVTVESNCTVEFIGRNKLNELLGHATFRDIAYMNPLWPDIAMSFYRSCNNILYRIPQELPPCHDAIARLKAAKTLHDELEGIYNPNVNFDGVYNLAAEHIQNYL